MTRRTTTEQSPSWLRNRQPCCCGYRPAIWGNHSATQYPDIFHAFVRGDAASAQDQQRIEDSFIPTSSNVVQRLLARGHPALPRRRMLRLNTCVTGSKGQMVLWYMAVYSDGSYDIEEGLIYSFPCTCAEGEWTIVKGLAINDFSRSKTTVTEETSTRTGRSCGTAARVNVAEFRFR